jgi:hypothetical protein
MQTHHYRLKQKSIFTIVPTFTTGYTFTTGSGETAPTDMQEVYFDSLDLYV